MTYREENFQVPTLHESGGVSGMTDALKTLSINSDGRLAAFNELAHLAARGWYPEHIEKAGLEFRTDGAGNHSAVLALTGRLSSDEGSEEGIETRSRSATKTLLLGSHLNSVPNGGRFDGALGVMAFLALSHHNLRTTEGATPPPDAWTGFPYRPPNQQSCASFRIR